MSALLEVRGITKRFSGLVANENVNLTLAPGEIRSIIGPNGAGKTTLISMISGHLTPTEGTITYEGRDITRLDVPRRARLGIVRKFQTPSVFYGLSVHENIELAVIASGRSHNKREARIAEVLEHVRLGPHAAVPASRLSHGQRQWLEIGLLLGNNARLLLLDEPTAGMTAEETHATGRLIRELSAELHLAAIIIEHDIKFIRDLEAPITVLHLGKVFREGSYEEISADAHVRNIYLGTE
jgi:ABC-type uncharacterized transport system ATPase subunit